MTTSIESYQRSNKGGKKGKSIPSSRGDFNRREPQNSTFEVPTKKNPAKENRKQKVENTKHTNTHHLGRQNNQTTSRRKRLRHKKKLKKKRFSAYSYSIPSEVFRELQLTQVLPNLLPSSFHKSSSTSFTIDCDGFYSSH